MPRFSRFFRLWGKKRGERRTGSRVVGAVGEAMFWGAMFLLGAGGLAALAIRMNMPQPDMRWALWLTVLVTLALIVVGSVGFVLTVLETIASPERRRALANKAADIRLHDETLPSSQEYPYIPRESHLTNSPGAYLAYRLPVIRSPVWKLLTAMVFTLLWNGTGAVLLVLAVDGHLYGQADWFLTLFLVPFLAAGAWVTYTFTRQLHWHTGVGPTIVEVSDLPFYPGRTYEITLAQGGILSVKMLEVSLVCDEEATYSQGTNVRTESCRVATERILREEHFNIDPDAPYLRTASLKVPSGAMHSFQAKKNSIRWKLEVRGQVRNWPEFVRTFPVLVYPPASQEVGA